MNVDFVGFFLLNAIDQNFRNIGSKNSMDVVKLGIVPSSGSNIFKNNKFYQCNLLNDNNDNTGLTVPSVLRTDRR